MVSEVYDPFIENHLKGIRSIGADWYNTLKSNGQDTRADAWKAFLDGFDAKCQDTKWKPLCDLIVGKTVGLSKRFLGFGRL